MHDPNGSEPAICVRRLHLDVQQAAPTKKAAVARNDRMVVAAKARVMKNPGSAR